MPHRSEEASWFLAQVKPNCVKIAEKNLRRQGFETFLPLEEETRKRSGSFVTALRPLFPGYIFVTFDASGGLWRNINSTYGVSRLVSFSTTPAPVPAALVSQLKIRCDESGKVRPSEYFSEGDHVRFVKGPFSDVVAEIVTIAPEKRVWVLMGIMGGQTRVAVDVEDLRAV